MVPRRPILLCGPGIRATRDAGHERSAGQGVGGDQAHLRANTGQFVNWFSFFLTFSFAALAVFVATGDRWPQPRLLHLGYAVPAAFLLLHMLAFGAILTFRHYIADADRRVVQIAAEAVPDAAAAAAAAAAAGRSPIPVRFCKWMTNFMAAGYLVSYFGWLLLFFVH